VAIGNVHVGGKGLSGTTLEVSRERVRANRWIRRGLPRRIVCCRSGTIDLGGKRGELTRLLACTWTGWNQQVREDSEWPKNDTTRAGYSPQRVAGKLLRLAW